MSIIESALAGALPRDAGGNTDFAVNLATQNQLSSQSKKQKISFGTYNAYGFWGTDEKEERAKIDRFASNTDIVGFQESHARIAGELLDTHGLYAGSQENPIFFNKEKFELVHGQDIVVHETANAFDTDQRRTTTFVVLRDKKTNALLLVTNRHMDHNSQESRTWHNDRTEAEVRRILELFPAIDARIDLGDYNSNPEDTLSKGDFDWGDHVAIDGIMAKGYTAPVKEITFENLGQANNDDFYKHHNMLRAELEITSDAAHSGKEGLPVQESHGAVLYEHAGYEGDVWLVGFGSDAGRFDSKGWDNATSSVRVSDGAKLELFGEADQHGAKTTYTEDTGNVGEAANDTASSWRLDRE